MPELQTFVLKDMNDIAVDLQGSRTRLLGDGCDTTDSMKTGSDAVEIKKSMKLVAEFALQRPPVRKSSKNIFKKSVQCFKQQVRRNKTADDADPEVINLKVPVENLKRNLFIQVDCRNTNINIELHPPAKNHFKKLERDIQDFQASAEKDKEAKEKQEKTAREPSKLSVFKKVFSKITRKSSSASSFKWLRPEKRENPLYVSKSLTCYSSGFLTRSTLFPPGSTVSLVSAWSRQNVGDSENRLRMYNTL